MSFSAAISMWHHLVSHTPIGMMSSGVLLRQDHQNSGYTAVFSLRGDHPQLLPGVTLQSSLPTLVGLEMPYVRS